MKEIMTQSFLMNNGSVFSGNRVNELIKHIVNKFADERLSSSEAILVLDQTKEVIKDFALVQHVDFESGKLQRTE